MEMSEYELCHPKIDFFTVIVSDLVIFFSSLFSSPLYLSYLIFFCPYILKLASFLSPLFFTVFIVVLTGIVREKDYSDDGDDDLGMYELLFGTRLMKCPEEGNPLEILEGGETEENQEPGLGFEGRDTRSGPVSESKNHPFPVMEERRLENFLKILNQFERMGKIEEKPVPAEGVRQNAATKPSADDIKVKAAPISKADHVDVVRKEPSDLKVEGVRRRQIEARKTSPNDFKVKAHSQRVNVNSNVDDHVDGVRKEPDNLKGESFRTWDRNSSNGSSISFGSMRREKEWKRTLACKLFEERHHVDGGEGMDSLWEAYEKDSNKPVGEGQSDTKKRHKKKSEVELDVARHVSELEDGDGDDDEVVGGQFCCLNAIKLSTGKLNLGMRRPNLVKISKAIKGFGWLHHVGKHSKKVHNNTGDRYL